jgi:hypothetical protein
MTMSGVQVIALSNRADQRVLRGKVQMTRPGEDPRASTGTSGSSSTRASDGRWRLWTVRETAGP